jgi:glycine cleavage system regulatory protein
MARLAGKFAGIVMVSVPDDRADALAQALGPLGADGLLTVTAERTTDSDTDGDPAGSTRLALELVGADRPGIVHDITRALAGHQVSIEELHTDTRPAPMSGDMLFEARATMVAPATVAVDELRSVLEQIANELMVDIELSTD